MSPSEDHERFSEDLQEVADVLREQRPELEPLELDRIKLRAMSGARPSTSSQRKGFAMRSRLVAFLTVGALALSGGTAMAGFFNWGDGFSGFFDQHDDASHHQYKPPCKPGWGYGDDHHCHSGPPGHHEWHFKHGWCWLQDGHGGFKWGIGDGWVYD